MMIEDIVLLTTDAGEAIRILGAEDRVIGVTRCIPLHSKFFPGLKDKKTVGSCFYPDPGAISSLKPDLVIAYADRAGGLQKNLDGIKVIGLDFYRHERFNSDLRALAKMLGEETRAEEFISWRKKKIDSIKDEIKVEHRYRIYTHKNRELFRTYSKGTTTHHTILMAGGINIASNLEEDYPEVSREWIIKNRPDAIVIKVHGIDPPGYDVVNLKEKGIIEREKDILEVDRIYAIPHKLIDGIGSFIGSAYLARWLYKIDLDPKVIHQEYLAFQGLL